MIDSLHCSLSWRRLARLVPTLLTVIVVVIVIAANWRDARRVEPPAALPVGTPGGSGTSRAALEESVRMMKSRLAVDPRDRAAAVALADTLLRQSRVTGNAGLAIEAEQVLMTVLEGDPDDYDARRMIGAVYLSQHRFREAVIWASRASAIRPRDAWNYGVQTDAHVELGEYEQAEQALQTMMQLRPGAPAYARAAYILELKGDLAGALGQMQMAAEATSAHDPESQAWHYAQVGDLLFQMGRLAEAEREYSRSAFVFEGHPFAVAGRARVKAAQGRLREAADLYTTLMRTAPSPDVAAALGDIHATLGDTGSADRFYALAEAGWRVDAPQPALLARFLAERNRKTEEAFQLAQRAAADRHDIFTEDALAWCAYRSGRLQDAVKATRRALRTGTVDRRILYHAAVIARATGDENEAERLVTRAVDGLPQFDPVLGPQALELQRALSGSSRMASLN